MSTDTVINSAGATDTVSNQGAGGVGLYKQKTGNNLEFKNINTGSNKVTVTDDVTNNEVDIDLAEANIVHDNLSGAGTNTHAQVDTHIADVANPHAVTAVQTGAAPSANGVTNGDAHDHAGGDGAQIDHAGLLNIGTNTHAQIDTHIATAGQSRAFDVYQSASQTGIANITWTKVLFETARFDLAGDFNLATDKYNPQKAGKYLVIAKVHLTSMTDASYVWGAVYKNGSALGWSALTREGAAGTAGMEMSLIVDMNGTSDYLEVYVKQNSGSSRATQLGASYTTFKGAFLEG